MSEHSDLVVSEPSSPTAPRVWVLLDDRAGNNNQSLGLADRLPWPREVLQIGYNGFVRLPNWLRGASLLGVDSGYTPSFEPPWPDVVIAAGRRLAPISAYIKKQNPDCRLIHIMQPQMDLQNFWQVILPAHDAQPKGADNIIQTTGALNPITQHVLDEQAHVWAPHLNHAKGKRIAVLVGGNSKKGAMTPAHLQRLMDQLRPVVGKDGALLVSTSRRTSERCVKALKKLLETSGIPYHLHCYGSGESNPYPAYLALSEVIVVTGESVSMCSEAAYTGKPVYVFEEKAVMTDKHQRYISSLISEGYVRRLEDYSVRWRCGKRLDESSRVAKLIGKTY